MENIIIKDGKEYKYGVIYMYTNILNNKKYIGQTFSEKQRYIAHRSKRPSKMHYFDYAIQKYGKENFKYEVLYKTELFENTDTMRKQYKHILNEQEKYYISLYKTNDRQYGYNISSGGSGTTGFKVTQAYKDRLKNLYTGTHHPGYIKGIPHNNTDAVKANLRKINYYKNGQFICMFNSLKECYNALKDELSSTSIQRLLHNKCNSNLKTIYKFEHVDKDKVKKARKIYQYDKSYKLIKKWNSLNACVKTKQYTRKGILYAIQDKKIYENSYWSYSENWCPIKEEKALPLF